MWPNAFKRSKLKSQQPRVFHFSPLFSTLDTHQRMATEGDNNNTPSAQQHHRGGALRMKRSMVVAILVVTLLASAAYNMRSENMHIHRDIAYWSTRINNNSSSSWQSNNNESATSADQSMTTNEAEGPNIITGGKNNNVTDDNRQCQQANPLNATTTESSAADPTGHHRHPIWTPAFPGSGSEMLRQVISEITGLESHDVYNTGCRSANIAT